MDGNQKRSWNSALTHKYRMPKPTNSYGTPCVIKFDLQFFLTTRLIQFKYNPANGVIMEAGVVVAALNKRIKSFKLKNQLN